MLSLLRLRNSSLIANIEPSSVFSRDHGGEPIPFVVQPITDASEVVGGQIVTVPLYVTRLITTAILGRGSDHQDTMSDRVPIAPPFRETSQRPYRRVRDVRRSRHS